MLKTFIKKDCARFRYEINVKHNEHLILFALNKTAMNRLTMAFAFFCAFNHCLIAQTDSGSVALKNTPKIVYKFDGDIEKVLSNTTDKVNNVEIYKIQIFSESGNNAKQKALDVKSEFESKNADVSASLIYQQPNFKVRVGHFRSKIDAQRMINKLKYSYPNAFIVKDDGKSASE